ncbi:MAG: condensation domain-containing protein, partial [Giesbergeria sp.]
WGGFIDGVDQFDALFFNISPREAQALDPQARLYLQVVWGLLESAGYTRDRLSHCHQGRVGVYVGAMAQPGEQAQGEGVIASLSTSSAIANRISHYFNFEGPSLAVDTMCSSAMMAIHLACKDLAQGECELAVAGGVNLTLSPQKYVGLSQVQLLGSSAQSRSFTDGDGHLPAETVGALLLKPLRRAQADGDPIWAVIKATATHHSGRSSGYAVPSAKVQAKVMGECLRKAGVAPEGIGWIEAAAAGNALSDALEMSALGQVFEPLRSLGRQVRVGAVKSQLGHPELASGVAQMAKVVLQLQHAHLVPVLDIGPANSAMRLDDGPLQLQRQFEPWQALAESDGRLQPRRALVNSFAAGGSYVSAVVEEYLPPPPPSLPQPQPDQLIVLSARDEQRLRAVAERALQRLRQDPAVELADLAYTLQIGREAMEQRLAVVVQDTGQLCDRLSAWLAGQTEVPGLCCGGEATARPLQPLLNGTPGKALACALVAEADLAGLALYWVQGGTVPWPQLHQGRQARRIVWATYPFAPTVYPIHHGAQAAAPVPALTAAPCPSAPGAGDLQQVLAQALADALGLAVDELPRHKPLRALGYNSIAAMALKFRLEAQLQRPMGLELIGHAGRTVAELAGLLAEATARPVRPEVAGPSHPVLVAQPAARSEPFPLTEMQESFLLGRLVTLEGDCTGAHIYAEIEAEGPLDIGRLNRAWNRLVARHDMLRAVIVEPGQQRILPTVDDYRCKVIDMRLFDEAERGRKARGLRETMEQHVFAGNVWPMFDIRVALHGERRYRIHFSIDELIVDGLSLDTLLRQWDRLYVNPDQDLPALQLSFRDYVLAMKAFESSARYQQDLAYWLERLADLPGGPAFAPPQVLAQGQAARRRRRLHYRLPAAGWQALQAKAAAIGVSPTALVLGVFVELLRAWSGSARFTLVLTYLNRPPLHPQIGELVGPAISSLLLVADPMPGSDLEAAITACHQQLWQALEHSSVSGIRALRQLRQQAGRDGRSLPAALPVVFTSMLGSDVTGEPLQGLGSLTHVLNQTPQVYLDHQLRESAAGLDCSWDVVEERFPPGIAQAMFEAYGQVLAGLAGGQLAWSTTSLARPPSVADVSVTQLAGFLAQAQCEDALAPFPLTDQQQAYAFGRDLQPAGGGCQVYQELRTERLALDRLEQSLCALIDRHPMLRTVVCADGSQAVQAQVPRYVIAQTDLRHDSPQQRQAALAATRHDLLGRATPLGGWPYFSVAVSWLPDEMACVHLCFDMMLFDSTSIGQLLSEWIQLYEQPQGIRPPASLRFRDYQRAVEQFQATSGHAQRLAYWRHKFAGLPGGPQLPQLPQAAVNRHQRISGALTGWQALKQLAAVRGIAPGLLLLTAYLEVLYAWNDRQPLAVVVPGWERLPVHPDIDRVVGDFTTLSWVSRDSRQLSFAERLSQVAQQHADDLAQRPVSGLQALRRTLRQRAAPLAYPVVFTHQITPQALPGTLFSLGEALSQTPQVHLDSLSSESGSRLLCHWDFAAGVYAPAMVQEMFDGYLRLLQHLGGDAQSWQQTDFSDLVRARRSAHTSNLDALEGVV